MSQLVELKLKRQVKAGRTFSLLGCKVFDREPGRSDRRSRRDVGTTKAFEQTLRERQFQVNTSRRVLVHAQTVRKTD